MRRRVPIDVVAFVAIAILVVPTHVGYVRYGMAFNDASWFFHFGNRVLHGDVPYRDFVFQVGPLPLYVDAGFQRLFGEHYVASLYASLAILLLRVTVVWLVARRLAGIWPAIPLVVFCAFDPLISVTHHWSTSYAELFQTTAGLFFVLAERAEARRQLVYLALAGASAALVVTARQSGAVVIGVVLLVATAIMFARRTFFTRRRFLALWAGYAGAMVLFLVALAALGMLGPAIQQMFLDAPSKKSVGGFTSLVDALSGGALVDWKHGWWGGFLVFLGLPTLFVGGVLYLAHEEQEIPLRTVALLAVPMAFVVGLVGRYASTGAIGDVPRMLLSTLVLLALCAPERLERWFGVTPLAVIGLGALPLASDWALEMSAFGRGWGDAASTAIGVALLALASTRASSRAKTIVMSALAAAALVHVAVALRTKHQPFPVNSAESTTLDQHHGAPKLRGAPHPVLRGVKLPKARAHTLIWLASVVEPGRTCFVYGNVPVLYDLLRCTNPTRLDTTAADFLTADDAEAALAILRANPPEYLIAQEKQWMSPSLELDLGNELVRYDGLNPRASMALHVGLRALLDRYVSVGLASDLLPPELREVESLWDAIPATRVYRRKP